MQIVEHDFLDGRVYGLVDSLEENEGAIHAQAQSCEEPDREIAAGFHKSLLPENDLQNEKYDGYNSPERSVSYYNKGQLLGVLLDLAIRDATDNHRSLDDLMRAMNDDYAKKGKFYDDRDGVNGVVSEVAGMPFDDFFRRYVSGTDELPYEDLFEKAGLSLKANDVTRGDLGFSCENAFDSGETVSVVSPGSAAEAAGLRPGDVVQEINGIAMPVNLSSWANSKSPGDKVQLRVRRDGRAMNFSFALGSRVDRSYVVSESPNATEGQRRIRDGLLHGTTN